MGFDSKCDFSPPTLVEASPLPLDVGSFVGRVQHSPVNGCSAVAVLEFSEEKMSACPSTLPSFRRLPFLTF